MKTGALTVFPIVDAVPDAVETTWSFPMVSAQAWSEVSLSGLNSEGWFQPSLGCFIVRSAGRTILCDTGIGPGPNAYLGGLKGALPARLAEIGIAPGEVDMVVFTHLHMDHIGWSLGGGGAGEPEPMFPNAAYVVAETEYRFWASDPQTAGAHHREAFHTLIAPLARSGRLTIVASREIAPGIRFLGTPGHTPGHASILFEEDEADLVVAGDIFHCPAQVQRPHWCHRADFNSDLARATRQAFIERACSESWLLACGHFRDGLQLGRIEKDGSARIYRPLEGAGRQGGAETGWNKSKEGDLQ